MSAGTPYNMFLVGRGTGSAGEQNAQYFMDGATGDVRNYLYMDGYNGGTSGDNAYFTTNQQISIMHLEVNGSFSYIGFNGDLAVVSLSDGYGGFDGLLLGSRFSNEQHLNGSIQE